MIFYRNISLSNGRNYIVFYMFSQQSSVSVLSKNPHALSSKIVKETEAEIIWLGLHIICELKKN